MEEAPRNYVWAEAAYNAYCEARSWKSVRGEPLPKFEAQAQELKDAWWEAAQKVAELAITRIFTLAKQPGE